MAEEVGIKVCFHPSEPPMGRLSGVPELATSFESFKQAMNLVPSDNHSLKFCLGCWLEMDEDLEVVIHYFRECDELFSRSHVP